MPDGGDNRGDAAALADASAIDPALGRVALVFMPFGSILQPSMALGQIQAQLRAAGHDAFSLYLNVEFAQAFGVRDYETIARQRGVDVQLGEWLFAAEAWDAPTALDEQAFLEIARLETSALSDDRGDPVERILATRRSFVPWFLDRCAETICGIDDLRVVGFSCQFFQVLPSIALARRIKSRRPEIGVVFGGPSMHDEMGRAYMEALPWLDAMSTGEADRLIPPLFRALALGEPPEVAGDVLWRAGPGGPVNQSRKADPADSAVLDALPLPDFENYFRAMDRAGFLDDQSIGNRIFVPFETSRGCWWGQKRHCTFCGLNPLGMDYRAKSPARALEIIRETRERWGVPRLFSVDNILPQSYYETVLPALRDGPLAGRIELFYEIKTNVSRRQIKLLADAGVKYLVPGIESLSTNMLRCIDKGVTALHNIYALKLFCEYGIMPGWNMLIRIPGERAADYTEMTALIGKLMHLHPPFGGPREVEMHRFSPYHFRAVEFVDGFRPQSWYRGLFPEGLLDIGKVAYYFDADWRDVVDPALREPLADAVWAWVDAWRDRPRTPKLELRPQPDGTIIILDSRSERHGVWKLDREEAAVYRLMDDPLPRGMLDARAEAAGIAPGRAAEMVGAFLDSDLALELDGKLLALAVSATAPEPSLAYRREVFQRVGEKEHRAASKDVAHSPAAAATA